jgi:hypothetical protein
MRVLTADRTYLCSVKIQLYQMRLHIFSQNIIQVRCV